MSEGMQEGRNAVLIDDKDNVVIAIYPLKAGDEVRYPTRDGGLATFVATEDIPLFHKIARVDIAAGQNVVKYGEFIGVATSDVKRGQHVHTQNCESSDDLEGAAVADVAAASEQKAVSTKCTRTFMGYRRSDGQVGIRNHVLVLPTSICASDTTERIARSVEGCVTFHNQNGCSQVNIDQQMTVDTLAGLAANPNIHSVLAVSLGCEGCQNDLVVDAIAKRTNKEVRTLIIQEVGEGNPSPGNMAGGLTTLEEKSLGCIHKAGHSTINVVYPYAAHIASHQGLVVMDTPGNDPSSVGGIIAGGCQLVVFSTGLGTPTGNAIAPVLRLTANGRTARTMADNIDFDAQATIYGPQSMEELRDELIDQIIRVCNGEPTCAEALGYTETALPHLCNYM